MRTISVLLTLLNCLLLHGCSAEGETELDVQAGLLAAPSRQDFPEVGEALQLRCATLDCHGQSGRNLRLYGYGGLRLPPSDGTISDFTADPTSDAEFDASYASILGLEPERLSRVSARRADPNQLSLVRKTRGIEKHKGGQLARVDDPLDRCIVRWLTNQPDATSCAEVVEAPRPDAEITSVP